MNERRADESLQRNYSQAIEQSNELLNHTVFPLKRLLVHDMTLWALSFSQDQKQQQSNSFSVDSFSRLSLLLAFFAFLCHSNCILLINEIEECGYVCLNVCGRRKKNGPKLEASSLVGGKKELRKKSNLLSWNLEWHCVGW